MQFNENAINMMAQNLQKQNTPRDFYLEIEGVLKNALSQTSAELGLKASQLNLFFVGEHIFDTNFNQSAPINIFVSLKTTKQALQLNKQLSKKNNKVTKAVLQNDSQVTDLGFAGSYFKHLINSFDAQTKLYVDRNIIIVQLNELIKLKIIVGYSFDNIFEYQVFNKYYQTDFLTMLYNITKKQELAQHFSTFIKMLKSIEVELFNFNLVTSKIFEKLNFLEHLVFNIPNNLLSGENFYDVFIKSLNYLKNCDFSTFKRADNLGLSLFNPSDKFAQYTVAEAKYVIKATEYFLNNFEKIYSIQ